MGELGLAGAVRGKVKRTTISDPRIAKPLDLVDRNFAPLAPDRLWVADFTYVSTWSGWCYTAFVIDAYARRILGWSTATTMTSQFVVDAVGQAIWTRQREGKDLTGLIAHHDHGVQGGFNGSSRLVQPPPTLRVLRRLHTRRGRSRSLRSPPGPSKCWILKLESLRTLRGGSGLGALQRGAQARGWRCVRVCPGSARRDAWAVEWAPCQKLSE